jgi:acetyl esterase/lipase
MSADWQQTFEAGRQEILADSRTFAFQLFRALPDTVFGLRLLHLIARPPKFLWPKTVRITCHQIAGRSANQTIPVWVLAPRTSRGKLPMVLHLHGGGYAIGTPEQDFRLLAMLIEAAPSIIVSPAYRLSLEYPFPAGFHDAAVALDWMSRNAAALEGDPAKLFIMGQSAGGGLAAALSHWAKDSGVVRLSGQLLIGAMLDDRTDTTGSLQIPWSWGPKRNRLAWNLYLQGTTNEPAEIPYAVPAKRSDLSNLAPAYGVVGTADLFLAENNAYFRRLAEAGVPTSLRVIPNAYHGVEVLAPRSKAGRDFLSAFRAQFRTMLKRREA